MSRNEHVVGLVRPGDPRRAEFESGHPAVRLVEGDLGDQASLNAALEAANPDQLYNLAAMTMVGQSFSDPETTAQINGVGVLRLLEAVRMVNPEIHFLQASSAEMFGIPDEVPQTEKTAFHPRSPYGAAKVYAHHITINYREAHGIHASSVILYNHESPLRSEEFVTRKITRAAARIAAGLETTLHLGNLAAERDWGFAGDYVSAMQLAVAAPVPGDYVIASGKTHSVEEFCELAFSKVGLDYREHVKVDPALFRPLEPFRLVGNPLRAYTELGWEPATTFDELVGMMVEHDVALIAGQLESSRQTR